jgi:hypothetical protein
MGLTYLSLYRLQPHPFLLLPSRPRSPSPSPPPSPASSITIPKEVINAHHTTGARIQALTLWEHTGIVTRRLRRKQELQSYLYIRLESRQLEIWHTDDAKRSGRPPISTALAKFIIETMTKNSTTRGWSCARIASEVSGTPGWQKVPASTVYRVLNNLEYYGTLLR